MVSQEIRLACKTVKMHDNVSDLSLAMEMALGKVAPRNPHFFAKVPYISRYTVTNLSTWGGHDSDTSNGIWFG